MFRRKKPLLLTQASDIYMKTFFEYRFFKPFKNKYILTLTIFLVYTLFIDDNDVFTLLHFNKRLHKIKEELVISQEKLDQTKKTLSELDNPIYMEKYAREKKFFKKTDEDIFVITEK